LENIGRGKKRLIHSNTTKYLPNRVQRSFRQGKSAETKFQEKTARSFKNQEKGERALQQKKEQHNLEKKCPPSPSKTTWSADPQREGGGSGILGETKTDIGGLLPADQMVGVSPLKKDSVVNKAIREKKEGYGKPAQN